MSRIKRSLLLPVFLLGAVGFVSQGCKQRAYDANGEAASAGTELKTSQVVFQCSLAAGREFVVLAKDGMVAFGRDAEYKKLKVTTQVYSSGTQAFVFLGSSIIDGVAHNTSITLGADDHPDSISSDGNVFLCNGKAKKNVQVLKALANCGATVCAR
jgi:hypothetical protein